MANLIEVVILAIDEASGTIARVAGETEAMGRGSMAVGTAMLAAGAAAAVLAAGIGKIAESGAEFQSFTQEIQNNTTMTDAQLGQMRETILAMSEDGGIAYEALGTAFMKVMNITNDAASSQEILNVAMESAVSTGGDVTSIANILANAMHEYNLDTVKAADGTTDLAKVQENAAHVMGIFHLAAAEGNMTLEQFAQFSGRAVGVAANLGVGVDEVSAAFASLTKHGFDAASSGTQMTAMLTHMLNPTQAAHKELVRLSQATGIDLVADFSAAGLETKGLTGVLDDLKEVYSRLGLSQAEAEQESMKLINAQRGGLGLATLLGTAWEDYNHILKDLNNTELVNTITEDQFNKVRETAVNQWQRLQQTLRATAITIGVEMLPMANALLGRILAVATGVLHWAQAHADLVGPLLATIGVVSAVMAVVLLLGGAFTIAAIAIEPILTGLGLLAGILTGPITAALIVAGIFLAIFRNQLADIGGIAVTAAQAVFKAFTTGDFNAAFGTIITAISKAFGPEAAGTVTLFVSHVLSGLQTLRDAALTFMQAVQGNWFGAQVEGINGFVRAIGIFGTLAHDVIVTFAQAVRGEWGGGATEGINAVVRAVGNLGLTLNQYGPIMANMVRLVADAFRLLTGGQVDGGLAGFIARLTAWASSVGTVFQSLLGQVVSWQLNIATALANWLAGALPGMLTGLAHLVTSIVDAIRGKGPAIDGATAEAWGGAFWKWVGPAIPPLLTALGKVFDALGTWIHDNRPKIEAKLTEWGQAFGEWVDKTAWPWLEPRLNSLLDNLLLWVQNTAAPRVRTEMLKISDALLDWFNTAGPAWLHDWDSLGNDLELALKGMGTKIGDFLSTVLPKLGNGLKDILPPWATDWDDFSNDARLGLQDVGDGIQRWIAEGHLGDLAATIHDTLPAWATDWDDFSNDARIALDDIGSSIGTFIGNKSNDLGDWLNNTLPTWATDWDDFTNDARLGLSGIEGAIGIFIGNKANDLNTWIMSWTPGWLQSWTALGTAVNGALTGIQAAISIGLTAVVAFFQALPGRIVGALGDLGGLLVGAGASLIQGLINGMNSLKQQVANIAGEIGALAAQAVRDALTIRSPSVVMHEIGVFIVQGLIDGMDAKQGEAAKKAAEVASAVAKGITDILAAMRELAQFDFAANGPSGNQMNWFTAMVTSLVASMAAAAAQFKEEALKQTADFADTAGKVGKGVIDALAGLHALATYDFGAGSPTGSQMGWFMALVVTIVTVFSQAAALFKAEALKSTTDLADTASKVFGLVTAALKAIADLASATKLSVPFAAVHALALTIGMIVQELGWVASFFKAEALKHTADFADSAGKVLGMVGSAVGAILKIPDVADPGFPAVHLLATIIGMIVQELGWVATFFKEQALKSAADFADSAVKVMGLFQVGILDGLIKLATFVAPSKKAIDDFLAVVFYVVQRFTEAALRLSTEGIKATTDFSIAAKTSLEATKTGTDAFQGFVKLVVPSKEAIDNVLAAIRYVVDRMLDIANQMGTAGVERAAKFGAAASTVAKGVTDVLELFKKFSEKPLQGLLQQGLAAVSADFDHALDLIRSLASKSQDFLSSAIRFKDNMEAAAGAIRAAADAITGVQGIQMPSLPSGPSGPNSPTIGNPKQGHADGGWVVPGQEYQVGERGSESFVSAVPGWIVPHGAGGGGGGGDTLKAEITLNLDGQKVTEVVYTRLLRKKRNNVSLGLG